MEHKFKVGDLVLLTEIPSWSNTQAFSLVTIVEIGTYCVILGEDGQGRWYDLSKIKHPTVKDILYGA